PLTRRILSLSPWPPRRPRQLYRSSLGPSRRPGRRCRPEAAGPGGQDLGPGRLSRRDLLPPPAGPGRGRTEQHGLVLGGQSRELPGLDLVRSLATLERPALGGLGCRHGAEGRHRSDARLPAPDRLEPAGEGPGRLPYQAGGPAGLGSALEPGGTALGASRSGRPSGRAIATAGPRRAGPGPDGPRGLEEGRSGVPPL